MVAEIEQTILALTGRGGLSVLLVEQHVGFALDAAGRYYVLASGRVTAEGTGRHHGVDGRPGGDGDLTARGSRNRAKAALGKR